jgi:hypothetical protein
VVQLAEDLSLAREALHISCGAMRLEELERDRPPGLLIDRAEDRAHAADSALRLNQEALREQFTGDGMAHELWDDNI